MLRLIQQAIARGVKIRINTNSLASSDNLQASSGYLNQRASLLKMGWRYMNTNRRGDQESTVA